MALIDFSNCTRLNTKLYGGSNGSKIGILYNNQKYLLKFSSKDCKGQYRTIDYGKKCPYCHSEHTYLLKGNEFNIKEIGIYEDSGT